MKQIYTLLTFLLTTTLFAQDLVMTVSVPPGTTECRFSGAFWNFDPFGGPVGVDNGNDTFTFTLSPAPTADMEYIYTINGTGVYEVIWDNAANAECTARIDNGNMITDYFSYGNRIWKTTDNLTWNEIYDDCSEATSCNPAAPGFTCIPDVNFETRLIELGIDNSDPSDLVDGLLDNAQAASVTGDLVLTMSHHMFTETAGESGSMRIVP